MATSAQIPAIFKHKLEKKYTIEEYYRREEKSIHKHEYHAGKIIRMPGGKAKHSRLGYEVSRLIGNYIADEKLNFTVFNSDVMVRIDKLNKIVYPDATVVCEKVLFFDDGKTTIVNPILVVEVLSPSTKLHDETTKFGMYRTIPSFKEYILVNQDTEQVSVFTKQTNGDWLLKDYIGRDATAVLVAIHNCPVSLAALYKGTENL